MYASYLTSTNLAPSDQSSLQIQKDIPFAHYGPSGVATSCDNHEIQRQQYKNDPEVLPFFFFKCDVICLIIVNIEDKELASPQFPTKRIVHFISQRIDYFLDNS